VFQRNRSRRITFRDFRKRDPHIGEDFLLYCVGYERKKEARPSKIIDLVEGKVKER